jgi:hypothetical protein
MDTERVRQLLLGLATALLDSLARPDLYRHTAYVAS